MGETDLIERALSVAPWVAPVLAAVVLLRKEIAGFLSSGRNEAALETLTGRMVTLFEKNLEYFADVGKASELMVAHAQRSNELLKDVLDVQRNIEKAVEIQTARMSK